MNLRRLVGKFEGKKLKRSTASGEAGCAPNPDRHKLGRGQGEELHWHITQASPTRPTPKQRRLDPGITFWGGHIWGRHNGDIPDVYPAALLPASLKSDTLPALQSLLTPPATSKSPSSCRSCLHMDGGLAAQGELLVGRIVSGCASLQAPPANGCNRHISLFMILGCSEK